MNKVKKEAPKSVSITKPVTKIVKEVTKQKPTIVYNDFVAAHQKLQPVLDENGNEQIPKFNDALKFFQSQFMREMCVSKQFIDQESSKSYLINPRTGLPYDSYIRS